MTLHDLTAAGWTRFTLDGFSEQVSPVWMRGAGDELEVGLLAEPRHCNTHIGTVHGGALMTFADIALGCRVGEALGHSRCVTLQLQLQFVSTGKSGELIVCRPELVRATAQVLFMRGLISAGGRTVASAEGMWKVLDRKPRD